jgi:hypothetical protein
MAHEEEPSGQSKTGIGLAEKSITMNLVPAVLTPTLNSPLPGGNVNGKSAPELATPAVAFHADVDVAQTTVPDPIEIGEF